MQACAEEVLRGALEGFNGTIMCYGQTGAQVAHGVIPPRAGP